MIHRCNKIKKNELHAKRLGYDKGIEVTATDSEQALDRFLARVHSAKSNWKPSHSAHRTRADFKKHGNSIRDENTYIVLSAVNGCRNSKVVDSMDQTKKKLDE